MSFQKALWRLAGGIAFFSALYGFQKSFRENPGGGNEKFSLPPDFQEKTEWAFARLMYPSAPGARFVRRYNRHGGSDWTQGSTSWTQDYPRADRHFSLALRRLTGINVRPDDQTVNIDNGVD